MSRYRIHNDPLLKPPRSTRATAVRKYGQRYDSKGRKRGHFYCYYNDCPNCGGRKSCPSSPSPMSMLCRKCRNEVHARVTRNLQAAVLMFWGCGFNAKGIAAKFKTSQKWIEQIITQGQHRLKIYGQANITRWAYRTGLLTLDGVETGREIPSVHPRVAHKRLPNGASHKAIASSKG